LNRLQERHHRWWKKRSPAEFDLEGSIYAFEEHYFKDLTLTDPRIRRKLLRYEVQMDIGRFTEVEDAGDLHLSLSFNYWTFRFRKHPDWIGLCVYKTRTIYVNPDLCGVDREATIVHEMIHAYEAQLSNSLREWLLLDLHDRMIKRIKPGRLRGMINKSTHSLFHEGVHGALFCLKSLDLDLRFGWKLNLGTTFGCGREELFA
jgi:hypothetical protein